MSYPIEQNTQLDVNVGLQCGILFIQMCSIKILNKGKITKQVMRINACVLFLSRNSRQLSKHEYTCDIAPGSIN